jgi:hypothetical protein
MCYNARYYDRREPSGRGTFISPDTLVPDPTNVWDYNRFAYARLNPMRYNDPTGHCSRVTAGSAVMLADMGFCPGGGPSGHRGSGGGAVVLIAGGMTAVAAGYLIGQAVHDLVQDIGGDVTPDTGPAGSTVHGDPLPVTSSASTSFPLADGGPETSIPASTGLFNDTLNVLADPLPGVDPTGHIYAYTSQLDKNMQAAGIVRPTDTAAHHIVAANDPRAARARGILAGAGIGINDAVNGVYLPANQNAPNPTGANVHSPLHTRRYHQEVETRLLNRGNQSVQSVLQQIRQDLQNGTFPYR